MNEVRIKPAALAAAAAIDVIMAGYATAFAKMRDVFEATNETGEPRLAMRRISEDLETLRREMARISRDG